MLGQLGPAELIILGFIALVASITGVYFTLRLRNRMARIGRNVFGLSRQMSDENCNEPAE